MRHRQGSDLIAAWIDSLEGGCNEPFGRIRVPTENNPDNPPAD